MESIVKNKSQNSNRIEFYVYTLEMRIKIFTVNCVYLIFVFVYFISEKSKDLLYTKIVHLVWLKLSLDLFFLIASQNYHIANMKVVQITQKPHKCPKCDERFKTTKNIPRHIELKHSGAERDMKRLQCCHCKKMYQTKGNHDVHFEKVHMAEYLQYVEPEVVHIDFIEGTCSSEIENVKINILNSIFQLYVDCS